jgi:RNA polymerase sigma-54 factor
MKNNMRIQLVPNLKLEQKQKYNSTQEKYLKILSSSYEELHQYILDKASTNPLIEYNSFLLLCLFLMINGVCYVII